jgi:hypothetical protein
LRFSRICLVTALALCAIAAPAHAAYPGKNGKLVLLSCNLHTINPDGTDQQQITFEPPCPNIEEPEWSPDGKRIAYTQGGDVFVINPDGSGRENVTQGAHGAAAAPSWSPDGTQIAYDATTVEPLGNETHIWIANSDGTGAHRLDDMCSSYVPQWRPDGKQIAFYGSTDPVQGGGGCDPGSIGKWLIEPDGTHRVPFPVAQLGDWSPDGSHITFGPGCFVGNCYGIWTQPADGSPATNITSGAGYFPHWSPDGKRIAFRGRQPGDSAGFVYTVATDGSDWQRVSTMFVTNVSWQPIPVNAYPRPRAATPVEVSLVPSYSPCTSPNRTHGPPLAFGSCAPPQRASDELTLGTPDANGKPAKGEGKVAYTALNGDVRIAVDLHDVYVQPGLAAYGGELRLRASMRITDKRNTPHPGGPGAATVSDSTVGATVPCIGTANPSEGSSCFLSTTANALAPGTVTAGARSVWELGQVQVDDGGADGDADTAGDNTRFMVQGLFVP